MELITSQKHAQNRFKFHVSTALAVLCLPALTQAADQIPPVHALESVSKADATAPTLKEIKVLGRKAEEDAGNDFRTDKAASPKYTEVLLNTPQTITVIKKELIVQQAAVNLTEALRNTPGVGTFFLGENGNTSTGDAVYMRGFDTSGSIYVDGVRDLGSISRDVFNIEQIDVLKGPAGTDSGRGAPTGSINLSSKQASLNEALYTTMMLGSAQQKRATVDVNRVLDANSGTAFRLNLMDQNSGNPARNAVKDKRWAVAPSLAFGLTGPTRIFLNYLHVKQDNVPDGGVPTIGLPGYSSPDPKRLYIGAAPMVDSHNFYGALSDFNQVTADMATLRIEHDFSPALKLQNTSRYGKTTQNYLLTSFMGSSDNLMTPSSNNLSTWMLARTLPTVKDQRNEILTNQTTLNLQLTTGAVMHSVVSGLELSNEKQSLFGYSGTGKLSPVGLYQPNPAAPAVDLALQRSGARSDGSTATQSVYVFDTIKFGANSQWQFNVGARADHYSTAYSSLALSTLKANPTLPVATLMPTSLDLAGTLFNGKFAALYKPTVDSSVYAMIATSRQPPGGSNFVLSNSASSAANPKFDPQATTTKEFGGKWDFLKQKLSLTAALYRTDVKNEVEQDPVDLQYYQSGHKRVQGIELGVVGELLRGWIISAGYTRMSTKVESGSVVTASGANQLNYTPKQALTAWTSYRLPSGLKLGGGGRFVDQLSRGKDGAVGTPAYTNAYWVFDAMASYPISKNLDLQLNLYNLADKFYVASINKSGYRYTPGVPRSVTVSANMVF